MPGLATLDGAARPLVRPVEAAPAPKHVTVATSGLPSLLTETKASTIGDGSASKWLSVGGLVLLHVLSLVMAFVVALLFGDKNNHVGPGDGGSMLAADGSVPGQLVAFAWSPVWLGVIFTGLTIVDAAYYVGSVWPLTAAALASGWLTASCSACLVAISSFSTSGATYAVALFAAALAAFAPACSVAVVLELLVRNGDLLQRVRAAVGA